MSFVARPDRSPTWADDLPEGWTAYWVKWSVAFASAKPDGEDIEKLPYISNEDITSWTGKLLKEDPEPADKEGRLFRRGDVLFNKLRPYLAKVYQADFDGISSGELLNLRASERVLPRFLFHVLSSYPFIDIINSESFGTKMPRADWETVGHQPLPLPNLDTQRRIAGYLDDKTARIDALIEKKRALLDRLAEKRQALISRAVTRGLNPDAPLKDSGIDWLGKVPTHWEVVPFKRAVVFQEGPGIMAVDFRDEGTPLLRIASIGRRYATLDGVNYLDESTAAGKWGHFRVEAGDLLISASASSGIVSEVSDETEGAIPYTGIIRLKPVPEVSIKDFIRYMVVSDLFLVQIEKQKTGTTIQHFGPHHLGQMICVVGSPEEQREIANFLDQKVPEIQQCEDQITASIEKLSEYRAALVTAAVTGKIKALLTEDAPKSAKKEAPAAFKRSVLAAYIADTLCDHPTFGRVKFQKLLHLCEAHLEIQEVAGNYHRDAAGPFDTQMMRSVHSQIEKQGWIAPVKGDKGWTYARGEKVDGYRAHFDRYFGDRKEALEDLLALIAPMKTQQAEIVSTAFAAWNDLLLEGKTPSDDEIVDLILNDWAESKKAISADRWRSALAWMREKGLTPRGLGEHTKRKS